MPRRVFITGSTGYLGRATGAALVARGHFVQGLCRAGSESRLPLGVIPTLGDPLDADSYAAALAPDHVVVHLVGTPKPAPWKAESFVRVDLGSVQQLVHATRTSPVSHVVYVSVAHPAPAMHAYISARERAEAALVARRLPLTLVRPWYVLGPRHRWPLLLVPLYWMADRIPSLRDGARRLGLVTLEQMVRALVDAVETADSQSRVWNVDRIRGRVRE
ncbi:MAG: NAD-dependent epimerase/dehydratase family protein [bacterium]